MPDEKDKAIDAYAQAIMDRAANPSKETRKAAEMAWQALRKVALDGGDRQGQD